ncbi:MAG: Rrf2 family transcriptional regulator [Chitinophagaceae bacterium]|nr:Rrf2 family transcriptional regulator [Chitinophagaceae bacterium]
MLSLTCKTAIKAVVYLASKYQSGQKAGIKEIAEFIDASEHTVGKMLQVLVKESVINSTKGPNGGFFISLKQMNQPIINIVESVDGKEVFRQYNLKFNKCSSSHPCPIHNDYKSVRDLFEKMCREKNVIDLCEPVNSGLAYLYG